MFQKQHNFYIDDNISFKQTVHIKYFKKFFPETTHFTFSKQYCNYYVLDFTSYETIDRATKPKILKENEIFRLV